MEWITCQCSSVWITRTFQSQSWINQFVEVLNFLNNTTYVAYFYLFNIHTCVWVPANLTVFYIKLVYQTHQCASVGQLLKMPVTISLCAPYSLYHDHSYILLLLHLPHLLCKQCCMVLTGVLWKIMKRFLSNSWVYFWYRSLQSNRHWLEEIK